MAVEDAPPTASKRNPRPTLRGAGRFGIGVKLQVAFGVVAGLTLIATAVAFFSFKIIEHGLHDVTERQVPMTINAERLSATSRDISATAVHLINARTGADQSKALASIEDKRDKLATVLNRMKTLKGDSAALATFVTLSQRLEANLAALEAAITDRNALRARIDGLIDDTHRVHADIIDRLRAVPDPTDALEIAARTHLLVSLIGEGSTVKDATALKGIQDRLTAAIESLAQSVEGLPDREAKTTAAQLIRLGFGPDSVIENHARELSTAKRVDATIEENAAILRDLDAAVASLVREAEANMRAGEQTLAAIWAAAAPCC